MRRIHCIARTRLTAPQSTLMRRTRPDKGQGPHDSDEKRTRAIGSQVPERGACGDMAAPWLPGMLIWIRSGVGQPLTPDYTRALCTNLLCRDDFCVGLKHGITGPPLLSVIESAPATDTIVGEAHRREGPTMCRAKRMCEMPSGRGSHCFPER